MNLNQAIEEFLLACVADGIRPATVKWYGSLLGTFADYMHSGEVARYEPGERPHLERFNDGDVSPIGDKCPRCGASDRQIKIGKMPSGSQRLKCQRCGKKYTPRAST